MEEDGDDSCNVTQTNQSPSVGKLQNVHQEECEPGAQLNEQRDTMQHSQSSVPDDYQSSALQSARNSKLNKVDSVDSGVGRSYSSSQLSHLDSVELPSPTAESILAPESIDTGSSSTQVSSTSTDTLQSDGLMMEMDDDCDPMQTRQSHSKFVASLGKKQLEQLTDQLKNLKLKASDLLNSLSEFEASLEKFGKEQTDQVEPQVEREVGSLKVSSTESSESTPNQPYLDLPERELIPSTPGMPTVDFQSQPYTRTTTNDRLFSDSKMTRDRKLDIKKKQVVKPRPLSEVGSSDACV